ncbi:MAG: cobalamin-dependent protein, partial [Treponema sp.]|nr:cobalamin-dependent protein [Treponema sp.]
MTDISLIFVSIHCERGAEAVPLGAATVASFVHQNVSFEHQIDIVEAYVDEVPSRIFDRLSCLDTAEGRKTIVGFSLYSWNRALASDVAKRYSQAYPQSLLVAGGPEVTAAPQGLSKHDGGPFSVLVQGEGESALLQVLQAWARGQLPEASCLQGIHEDLTALPSPWLSGFLDSSLAKQDASSGALWELARGCPYACTYCYESKGSHRLRYISEE